MVMVGFWGVDEAAPYPLVSRSLNLLRSVLTRRSRPDAEVVDSRSAQLVTPPPLLSRCLPPCPWPAALDCPPAVSLGPEGYHAAKEG